jgi:DNA-binding MarR family transcriptional regulator
VRRERCGEDRRGAFAVLTDEGFAALEGAAPMHVGSVRRHLFDQLSPEQQRELTKICDRLLEHLLPIAKTRGDPSAERLDQARRGETA